LCKLTRVKIPPYHTSLCFFKILYVNNDLPICAVFLKEDKNRGIFTKFTFVHEYFFNINCFQIEPRYFQFNYFPKNTKYSSFSALLKQKSRRISEDFLRNARLLKKKSTLEDRIMTFILKQHNTSFICNDSSSNHLVSFITLYILLGSRAA
jgi:hypothetical protein